MPYTGDSGKSVPAYSRPCHLSPTPCRYDTASQGSYRYAVVSSWGDHGIRDYRGATRYTPKNPTSRGIPAVWWSATASVLLHANMAHWGGGVLLSLEGLLQWQMIAGAFVTLYDMELAMFNQNSIHKNLTIGSFRNLSIAFMLRPEWSSQSASSHSWHDANGSRSWHYKGCYIDPHRNCPWKLAQWSGSVLHL